MRRAVLRFVGFLAILTAPAAFAQPAPMSSYWPHEDGRSWFYDQHFELFVPPNTITNNLARLYFEGTTVAPGGQPAQVLKGSVSSGPAAPAFASLGVPAEVTNPFLRRLWVARPDLRPGILRAVDVEPCPRSPVDGWEALLLSGGFAWVQSASQTAAWRCDASNTLSWLWLTSDLDPGSTATLNLIPDLASDVYLHLTVRGIEDVTVPAGTFPDCLHVDYVIDYGWSLCTDQSGNHLGTSRFETTGFVRYAPEVGPIESFEEFGVAEQTGFCNEPELAVRVSLKLNAPSVPAAASSWGRLKAGYR